MFQLRTQFLKKQVSKIFRNFKRAFTPRNHVRSPRKFGKTRFRRFPTFHFSTPKKKNSTFGLRRLNFERPFIPRAWPVRPPNFAKTRFRRFPTFHFSTPKKNILRTFCEQNWRQIKNELFWRSHDFVSVTGRSASKNDPRWNCFQVCTTFSRGVTRANLIFSWTFG